MLQSLIFAIGLITANVPEGLLPQLTIILTLAARRMKVPLCTAITHTRNTYNVTRNM